MPNHTSRSVAIVGAAILIAGCSASGSDTPATSDPPLEQESPSTVNGSAVGIAPAPPPSTPPDAPPTAADTAWTVGIVDVEKDVSGVVTNTAARAASQDGFDRFVLEFTGDELPSYHLEYIDRPVRQCGSGNVVDVAGDGWLQIRLEPAQAHTEEGRPTIEERSFMPRLPVILQSTMTCDFEAQVEWVLGVGSPNRFRVTELSAPARLVVDVRR